MTANVLLLFEFDPLVTFALEELVTLLDVKTPEIHKSRDHLVFTLNDLMMI